MPTLSTQNLDRIAEILAEYADEVKRGNTIGVKWKLNDDIEKQAHIDYDELLYLARCCRAEAKRARGKK